MNFFSHAVVARRIAQDAAFVLGAMLPDFCAMAHVRLQEVSEPRIAAGVSLHHATDLAFHGHPEFVRLCAAASGHLQHAGLSRGSSRAIAHIGIEMLLDGLLLDDQPAIEAYRQAVRLGPERIGAIRTRPPAAAGALEQMLRRLAMAPLPAAYAETSFVADRLYRMLQGRPRLRFDRNRLPAVRSWAQEARQQVAARARALLEGTCHAVRAADTAST